MPLLLVNIANLFLVFDAIVKIVIEDGQYESLNREYAVQKATEALHSLIAVSHGTRRLAGSACRPLQPTRPGVTRRLVHGRSKTA
jgi:hypothetical protein